jgi:hypothetical protein
MRTDRFDIPRGFRLRGDGRVELGRRLRRRGAEGQSREAEAQGKSKLKTFIHYALLHVDCYLI